MAAARTWGLIGFRRVFVDEFEDVLADADGVVVNQLFAFDLLAVHIGVVGAPQINDVIFGAAFLLGVLFHFDDSMIQAGDIVIQEDIRVGLAADADFRFL